MRDDINEDTLADLLVVATAAYRKRDVAALDRDWQYDQVRKLNSYGVLSIAAISAILAISSYHVEKALGNAPRPSLRGHLNPAHLTMLSYALSQGDISSRWVREMTENGTSISTISDLTGISEATLYRRKHSD